MSNISMVILCAPFLILSFSLSADPFLRASCKYDIDKDLLMSIAIKESSLRADATNTNTNGSTDVCMMQINTAEWLPKLANTTEAQLKSDVYFCVEVGAWVLAQNFRSHGRRWLSVGAYNAGFSQKLSNIRDQYIRDIKGIYRKLQNGRYDKRLSELGVRRSNKRC